ncbi:hypothetical protein RQCS_62070 (plasmid) [Rhodococcus qingshengii]|uniref:hypothetical protein n=1 Tax=Rhodococcus qingshengii TaxID=334542 RepID=UPI0007E57623|nr:hypothetical protein [Rhodococcus qingshengii]BCF86662.1 hypothetical protein RQCS_62070 [Rhodococcus qingshengii]
MDDGVAKQITNLELCGEIDCLAERLEEDLHASLASVGDALYDIRHLISAPLPSNGCVLIDIENGEAVKSLLGDAARSIRSAQTLHKLILKNHDLSKHA